MKKFLSIVEQKTLLDLCRSGRPRSIASHALVKQLSVLAPGLKYIVDGGANHGQFSRACANYFPDASIVAFEPFPITAEELRSNLKDISRVTIVEKALGEIDDSLTFKQYSDSQCSSFLDAIPGNALLGDSKVVGQQTVQVCRLETYLAGTHVESPSLLKLDLQGFERPALLGAGNRLRDFDYILVECPLLAAYENEATFTELVLLLAGAGYGIIGILNTAARQGAIVQVDVLFASVAANG